MVFARSPKGDGSPVGNGHRTAIHAARLVRWIVLPGAAIVLALGSIATVAGVSSIATSLGSASSALPGTMLAPARIALAAPTQDNSHSANAIADIKKRAAIQHGKSGRLASVSRADLFIAAQPASISDRSRFDHVVTQAALSPDKLEAAFAQAGILLKNRDDVHLANAPVRERFYYAAMTDRHGPNAERFGPRLAEPERSSRLALALAGESQIEIAFAPARVTPTSVAAIRAALSLPQTAEIETDTSEAFALIPDSVPLPSYRPHIAVARQQSAPPAVSPSDKPAEQQQVLAFAKPDNPDAGSGLGQAFKDLFGTPRPQNGVAIYDISAQTVTLPNGQKLEAHSGLGHMVDKPRYANVKNRGPTPPNTYDLVMRESLFHGVEAIRLLPVDGKKKYGRDGLLAHSYMLRGGLAQSNGCVVFEEYDRFLKAFKKGRIKRLVVVPGNRQPATNVASNGRGV